LKLEYLIFLKTWKPTQIGERRFQKRGWQKERSGS